MTDKKVENNEEEFPGYPHYPAKEDIMNSKDNKRVEIDVEDLSQSAKVQPAGDHQGHKAAVTDAGPVTSEDDEIEKYIVNEADLTDDDLIALNDSDTNYGSAETLSGEDLDVPGAEDDDENEEIGEEDEENNYYSLGGDAHENLDEDKDEISGL